MGRYCNCLGRIHGNGKEKAHKAMPGLLEKMLSKDSMNATYKRVCAKKGAGGVDGVTAGELGGYIKGNWESIRGQIRRREYRPQPGEQRYPNQTEGWGNLEFRL